MVGGITKQFLNSKAKNHAFTVVTSELETRHTMDGLSDKSTHPQRLGLA
jgi:hypothetical protein